MTHRPPVDVRGFVNVLVFAAIAILVLSLASVGSWFTAISVAAVVGGGLGWAVFAWRSRTGGLGSSLTSEHPPEFPGTINMAHIPVIGIGGLGIVAMALFVGLMLPRGQVLLGASTAGAIIGATAFLVWRHYHAGTPFAEHPGQTLHLR